MSYTAWIIENVATELLKIVRSWDEYELRTREICAALKHVESALLAEKFERQKRAAGITMSDDEIVGWLLCRRSEAEPLTPDERREWLEHVVACGGVEGTALA